MTITTNILIASAAGFIVGAVVTWLILRASAGEKLKKSHAELKEKHKQLQKNIDEHFQKTALSIDKLTDSYQEVFSNLSNGAHELMSKEAFDQALNNRHGKSVTLAYLSTNESKEKASDTTHIEHNNDDAEKDSSEAQDQEGKK